jgi:hypothetical protein
MKPETPASISEVPLRSPQDEWHEYFEAHGNGTRDYIAEKPLILGEVPEEEREAFTNLPVLIEAWRAANPEAFSGIVRNSPIYKLIEQQIPRTLQLMDTAIEQLGIPNFQAVTSISMGRITAPAETAFRTSTEWHSDRGNPVILINSNNSTEFYSGPARIQIRTNRFGVEVFDVEEDSLDPNAPIFTPPDFSIVLLNPWTIHRSPTAVEETTRTHGAFAAEDLARPRSLLMAYAPEIIARYTQSLSEATNQPAMAQTE